MADGGPHRCTEPAGGVRRYVTNLQQLDPAEFEELVAGVWDAEVGDTIVTQAPGDRGVDVEAVRHDPVEQHATI